MAVSRWGAPARMWMGISRFALRPTVFIHTPPPGLMKPFCMFRIIYLFAITFRYWMDEACVAADEKAMLFF